MARVDTQRAQHHVVFGDKTSWDKQLVRFQPGRTWDILCICLFFNLIVRRLLCGNLVELACDGICMVQWCKCVCVCTSKRM